MRLLLLNQYFPPDAAASAQLLAQLTEDLATDHEVWVVTGRPSYNLEDGTDAIPLRPWVRQRFGRVRLFRMWSTSFSRERMAGRVLNYLSFLASSLVGAALAPRPDVVMAWTDPPPITAVGAWVARLRRVPFVLVCQDIVPESVVAAGELSNPAAINLLARSARTGFRRAARVVAIGDDMRERLVDLGVPRERVQVIRNWADGRTVRPLEAPNAFRLAQGWDREVVVMHSGNLGMGQDLDAVIEAAALLADRQEIVLAIVGEGIRKRRYQERVRELGLSNVRFLPFQPADVLPSSLDAADIHLVAHRRGMEGFQVPSKLYGILASGTPVVAAVVSDSEVAATVSEADCGIVTDPDDPAGIAAAIETLARDADRRRTCGERARRAFEARYDRPIATAAYAALLGEVTEGSRP